MPTTSFRRSGAFALSAAICLALTSRGQAQTPTVADRPKAVRPAASAPRTVPPNVPRGPDYTVEPVPAWVVPAAESTTARVDAAPMHYRVIDEQIRVEATRVAHYEHVVRVLNDAAGLATASQIEIEFDPSYQTFTFHRLAVLRAGRTIDKLDRGKIQLLRRETQLERQMVDGRTTVSIVLDDVRVGDQIDLAYTVRGANPVFDGKLASSEWMISPRGPVALYQLRLLAPADRSIRSHAGSSDIRVDTRGVGDQRETVFRREAVPALRTDAGAPYAAVLPQVVQLSEFADWSAVAAWGRQLFASPAPGPLLDRKADEIRAASPEKPAQLLAALQFVQREVRYFGNENGIGSHRPAPPEEVIARRFGDCKDKVNLLIALLRRLDIDAAPVLVSPMLRSRVEQQLPGPLAFEHVIARVELGGQIYWLDATRNQQTGSLTERQATGFGKGLVLAPGSTGLTDLPTPFDALRMSVADTVRIARFAEPPTLESRITYRGDLADGFRELVAQRGVKDMAVDLTRAYLRVYPSIQAVGEMRVEAAPEDAAITFVQQFSVPGFWRFPEQRLLQADVVEWGVAEALGAPRSESRRDPFGIAFPGVYRHTVAIEYPEDVYPKPFSQHFEDGDRHVALKVDAEGSPRRLLYTAEARLRVEQVEASDWPAYIAQLAKLLQKVGATAGAPALPLPAAEALGRDLKELDEQLRRGKVKVATATQAQAMWKTRALSAQLDAGRLAPPLRAQALTARGIQYDHLGRLDEARSDFAQSLALVADSTETQNAAAVNALQSNDLDRALALTAGVLARHPRDAEALGTRALALYFGKDLAGAIAQWQELLKDPAGVRRGYPVVWLALAQRQRGGAVAPLRAQVGADLPTDWPRPVVDFALGDAGIDAVLDAAKAAKNPAEPLCEAYFYIGEKYLADGDLRTARDYWRKSVDLGVVEFVESGAAKLRLAGVGLP